MNDRNGCYAHVWHPATVVRLLTLPLRRRQRPAVREKVALLKRSELWTGGALRAWQNQKLTALVRHCYSNVPYYKVEMDRHGIAPGDIRAVEDLSRFPVLEKADIQSRTSELISLAHPLDRLAANATSGSTGHPLQFFHDESYLEWAEAARLRAWRLWFGLPLTEVEALLWGAIQDIGRHDDLVSVARSVVRDGVLSLNTFDLDRRRLARFIRRYERLKPKLIRGYASSLVYLADYLRESGIRLTPPKFIISSAEVLYPAMRERIEEGLGAEIFDSYGCREVSHIAQECCAHNGLHIAMENQIVELLEGSLIVTNLNNWGMPFIRYRVGDMARAIEETPCRCGRHSHRLIHLMGRDNENIELPNGKIINGEFFEFLFFDYPSVRRFQVEYNPRSGQLTVRLQADGASDFAVELRQRIANLLSHEQVSIDSTEEFRTTPSGKFRFVFNREE